MFDNIIHKLLHDADFFVQSLSALGQVLSALVGMLAAIAAFRSIKEMQKQKDIQLTGIGMPKLTIKIGFSKDVPVTAKHLLDAFAYDLKKDERSLIQLKEILERWKIEPFKVKRPVHNNVLIEVKHDKKEAVSIEQVEIHLVLICPPSPQPVLSIPDTKKWQKFTFSVILKEYQDHTLTYIPLEGLPICNIRAEGKYTFVNDKIPIKPIEVSFNDFENIIGSTETVGASKPTNT